MKQLLGHFCQETTIHGFKDLHCARSKGSKLFWALIIAVGLIMTWLQIYNVAKHFYSDPTKTQITLLSPNERYVNAPYVIRPEYFTEWIDLNKVHEFGFDLETFLFAMAHFHLVYTNVTINVTEAGQRLEALMKRMNIFDIYTLGMALASPKPLRVIKSANFTPYFDQQGGIMYVAEMNPETANSTVEFTSTTHHVYINSFTNFEETEFHRKFINLFNRSILTEYMLFNRKMWKNRVYNNNNLISSMPFMFNVVGEDNTYSYINVLLNKYEFYLKPTLYVWSPTKLKSCIYSEDIYFHVECEMLCSLKYQPSPFNCRLYIVPENYTEGKQSLKNSCMAYYGNSTRLSAPEVSIVDFSECLKTCMSTCKKWDYQFSSVVNPYPIALDKSFFFTEPIAITYTARDNVFVVSLLPYVTWDDALANVGGLLGLWLGGSIISFVQILYTFCWLPMESWCTRNCKKTSNKLRVSGKHRQNTVNSVQYSISKPKTVNFYDECKSEITEVTNQLETFKIATLIRLRLLSEQIKRQSQF